MENRTAAEAVEAIRACYTAQTDRFIEAGGAGSWRDKLTGWLSGGGSAARRAQDQVLAGFHQELGERVEELRLLLADLPEGAPGAAAEAVELLLFHGGVEEEGDTALTFALAALEGLAQPLIPYLEPAAAEGFRIRYQACTPPRRMLPNQSKIFGGLKDRAAGN